ncbi:AbrB family transcriptional regulator [Patulibacter brassicae]|uniref:AbrB family transcriptional regulator n=1 Tax=Patulibacter brassicae TaxID=1705717 RepID=A0ABU4VFX2_9ACTN|nr:AbrB family transcriptional regulator [Patulibacter brassicae]MDX8150599.1 AbrB family transcriptional regulator [Patulibacter brassicae]
MPASLQLPARSRGTATSWTALLAATAVGALAADAVGLPTPAMFAGLLVGLAWALRGPRTLDLPEPAARASQALLGVSLGLYVQSSTLAELRDHAPIVLAVLVLTLGASVLAGELMARLSAVDRPTAAFGMIAGGASGIVAISRELGADERLVAVMQYLRVLVIVLLAPIVAGVWSAGGGGDGGVVGSAHGSALEGLAFTVLCVGAGALLARVARIPAGSLLGPLIVAAGLVLAGARLTAPMPDLLLQAAYAGIGLSVGLRFTVASLRQAARILPATLLSIAALIAISAAIGWLLVALTDVAPLDAYLATTPGGLYAVLAASTSGDVDTTFVLALQVLRLFAMLLLAPALARWVSTRR